jgi:hypothetical protein
MFRVEVYAKQALRRNQHIALFAACCLIIGASAYFLALKMKVAFSSETSMDLIGMDGVTSQIVTALRTSDPT